MAIIMTSLLFSHIMSYKAMINILRQNFANHFIEVYNELEIVCGDSEMVVYGRITLIIEMTPTAGLTVCPFFIKF